MIQYSSDGITWRDAEVDGDPSTSVILHKVAVLCEEGCPPYETATAEEVSSEARRQRNRRGRIESDGVNQLADFTDNMWCRRGSQITAGDVDVRGVRVDGT